MESPSILFAETKESDEKEKGEKEEAAAAINLLDIHDPLPSVGKMKKNRKCRTVFCRTCGGKNHYSKTCDKRGDEAIKVTPPPRETSKSRIEEEEVNSLKLTFEERIEVFAKRVFDTWGMPDEQPKRPLFAVRTIFPLDRTSVNLFETITEKIENLLLMYPRKLLYSYHVQCCSIVASKDNLYELRIILFLIYNKVK